MILSYTLSHPVCLYWQMRRCFCECWRLCTVCTSA